MIDGILGFGAGSENELVKFFHLFIEPFLFSGFTLESNTERKSFLDFEVVRDENSTVQTTIHRKPSDCNTTFTH